MHKNRALHSDNAYTIETNKAQEAAIKYFTSLGITWPTETDMMEKLISEYKEVLPGIEFKPLVKTAKKLDEKGILVRPDTFDTYKKFIETYYTELHHETIALVTTQPHGIYQYQQALVAFQNLPINITIVAGRIQNPQEINFSVIFDSLARSIYAGKTVALTSYLKKKFVLMRNNFHLVFA